MLSPELSQRLANLSTALLADARVRLKLPESHLDPGIRPVVPFTAMVGTAVTAELETVEDEAAADLTPLLDAYQAQSRPGSIIVIEIPRELHGHGIFGEGAATLARRHGFAGALIEGAVRDTPDLARMEFPAWSRTVAPGYIVGKSRVAAAGRPVRVGGRTIHPGDIVAADNDGVIVIRPGESEAVIARAEAIKEWEQRVHQASSDGADYREVLRRAGPMP